MAISSQKGWSLYNLSMVTMITKQKKLNLFFQMLRIRMVQERIESLYCEDEMKTPVHLCIGQEAVAVGVCAALDRSDYISSNHRSHGHYMAKGGDLSRLIAELHCREDGCSKGYGGSMHVIDTSVGHLGSSSIVGGGIPIGTGLGLSIQMQNQDLVSVIFFGDGAADEGVLYESINFAVLKKLPVIFVLENNQWSVCSHVSVRQPDDNIFHNAKQDALVTMKLDGNNVEQVYLAAKDAVIRAKKGFGPSFMECRTYRIHGHAGSKSQDLEGYRDQVEIERWRHRCPVKTFQQKLQDKNVLSIDTVTEMTEKIELEINESFEFAKKSPLPTGDELEKYLFSR